MRGKAGRAPSTDGFLNRQENSSKLQPSGLHNLGAGVGETKLQPSSLRTLLPCFIRRRALFLVHLALLLRHAPPGSVGSADILFTAIPLYIPLEQAV
jgi:hypothetical protein